jgi:hypothetical protein
MVPENMVTTLLRGINGDMLYSHEGQYKTKEKSTTIILVERHGPRHNKFLAKCDK